MPKLTKGKSLLHWLNAKRRRRRNRRGGGRTVPRPLSTVLERLDPEVLHAEQERCPLSHAEWQEVAGIRIADHATPRRIDRDGVLLITVTSSVWAQELSLLSSSLCERLASRGFRVRSLRFLVGAVTPPRRGVTRHENRHVPPPAPIPEELRRALNTIEDDDLRDLIEQTAASSLAATDLSRK